MKEFLTTREDYHLLHPRQVIILVVGSFERANMMPLGGIPSSQGTRFWLDWLFRLSVLVTACSWISFCHHKLSR